MDAGQCLRRLHADYRHHSGRRQPLRPGRVADIMSSPRMTLGVFLVLLSALLRYFLR